MITAGRTETTPYSILTNSVRNTRVDSQISYWGNNPEHKYTHTLRVGFLNINSFPSSPVDPKNTLLRDHIEGNKLDVFFCAETNINWNLVNPKGRLKERIRSQKQQSSIL